ncbi:MAG: peptidoglycan bridge formation glycyltransferase FemA/FemB family protein [Ardenticatenales bacterium]|nr:peptidoglycan bridge formation glycyltransferase FemA/FemB family protein [Ardenticatenales bacterium]
MIEKSYVYSESEWEQSAQTLPLHHILQAWAWGEFKARWGWRATRLLWRDGQPVAAAQLLRRPIPRTPFGIGYVSKGPLLDPENPGLAAQVLNGIEAEAQRQRCLFVKIDPDVLASCSPFVSLLERRGWRRGDYIQFPNTGTIDLRPDEEALLANMKSKTRYNVRLAERRSVEVRLGRADEFGHFYQMYAETSARDGFLIRPRDYYLDLWRDFHARGLAEMLLACVDGEAVAGLILFYFGSRAWYFYGASTEKERAAMPNYALQWAAIQRAKAHGATEYDLWGAPDRLDDPEDGMAGVWRFKTGFDAQFREQIGAWDFPAFSLGYRLYTDALPRLRGILASSPMS